MLSLKRQEADKREMDQDLTISIWKEIRGHLENKKGQIYEEIKNYPPPIPACDAQFNHLVEERSRIAQELGRLDKLSKESVEDNNDIERIEEFIKSSPYLNDEAEQNIRSLFLK